MIKELTKRVLYPHAYSSDAFVSYLRRRGVEVGEGCYFFDARTINVDLQRPHMLRFGNYVKVTGYVHILCHDYSRSVVLQSGGVTSERPEKRSLGTMSSLALTPSC